MTNLEARRIYDVTMGLFKEFVEGKIDVNTVNVVSEEHKICVHFVEYVDGVLLTPVGVTIRDMDLDNLVQYITIDTNARDYVRQVGNYNMMRFIIAHEIGHIINDDMRSLIEANIDIDESIRMRMAEIEAGSVSEIELRADEFAEMLVGGGSGALSELASAMPKFIADLVYKQFILTDDADTEDLRIISEIATEMIVRGKSEMSNRISILNSLCAKRA